MCVFWISEFIIKFACYCTINKFKENNHGLQNYRRLRSMWNMFARVPGRRYLCGGHLQDRSTRLHRLRYLRRRLPNGCNRSRRVISSCRNKKPFRKLLDGFFYMLSWMHSACRAALWLSCVACWEQLTGVYASQLWCAELWVRRNELLLREMVGFPRMARKARQTS